ncbi:MAG TPA: LuxR C-terminal-related transcriptional regulator [Spirochaetota bacterium]|nr:LuxR C-terminal-related transcriptional regulator [Spirochaetota bacterium]HSA13452.1 LuxR C-terminal-related transcriptional regulator [Spirochaetota bacterium]
MLIYMVLIIDVFKLIKYPIAGDASVVICIWVAGFGYSIARYRFLSITPEYISSELLSNIEESVMLLGPDKNIITINNSAKEIIDGRDSGNVTQFSKNIPEYDIIDEKVNALLDGSQDNFTYRVSFNNGGGPTRYFDARFSLVRDRFNDILGILVIAREDRDLNQLKTIHKITDRQMDIITMALSGLSNRELAARLNISEKTVENHMINIYNKLGVNNKIELYNLVKQYHVGGNPASA